MTDESQALAIEGVRFFGEMSASISHEVKNVLAIINENAGLLQDLLMMSEKGLPLSPERLSRLAQSILRQVERGDRIVRGMNQLAHSADHAEETVDVGALVGFVSNLAARLIAMKGAAPRIEVPDSPVTAVTNRFFLENLVWACICRAMNGGAGDRGLTIKIEPIDGTTQIRFFGPAGATLACEPVFPSPREIMVARLLGARLTADGKKDEINLTLLKRRLT